MLRRLAALLVLAAVLVPAAASAGASGGRPRVTNDCPVSALPLRRADFPAVRRLALALAPHGVHGTGGGRIDYRDARAHIASFPTFFKGLVRSACPAAATPHVIARTADVLVRYPRVTNSASLSYSIFLIARTSRGLVGWAQAH